MRYYYYPMKAGSLSAVLKTDLRFLSILVISLLFSATALAQDGTVPDIAALLQERTTLVSQAQSTREIDLQLFNAGYRPKAIISTEILENGSKRIAFPTYLLIPEERKERLVQRLTAHYTYLYGMEIDTELRQIIVNVPATVSAAELDALFDHFGYLGYEEH